MCGIVGIYDRDGTRLPAPALLAALTRLMERRGPDDERSWSDDHVAIGFRRLAILDLTETGAQPMATPDGRFVLAYNGELYNFRALRAELVRDGVVFRGTGDTEVVLWALARWGTDALRRFNGMFALACYDTEARTLVLARDPAGIKPLYYHSDPGGLVFGSQYDQVIRHPWCDRSVDPQILGLYLRFGYIPSPFGLVTGTAAVEAGTFVTCDAQGVRVERYHEFAASTDGLLSGAEADEAVQAAIAAAVQRQLVSDVPVGAFLSGGVDSPLVVANMRQGTNDGAVRTYTIGSDDPVLDESAEAQAYAAELGVSNQVRRVDGADALAIVDDVVAAYSEPFADHSAFPTMLVSAFAARDVTVVLSGDGGDEAFWGYPRSRKVLDALPWHRLPRAARFAAYAAGKYLPGRQLPRGVLEKTVGDWYRASHTAAFTAPAIQRLYPEGADLPADFRIYDFDASRSDVGVAQWLQKTELRGHLEMMLRKVDRASMYYGIEVRVPLLDLEVLGAALRLDPATCLDATHGKAVLRRALARHVPAESIPEAKRGFDVPVGAWLRYELRPLVQDTLLSSSGFAGEFFNRVALQEVVGIHLGGADRTQMVWTLLSLELWAARHLRPLEVATGINS